MRDVAARFWSKVDKSAGAAACWPWRAARFSTGYGAFRHGGRPRSAHRVAYALAYGAAPEDGHNACVCHTCDNKACVNPAHLFLGTQLDNMRDRAAKGRDLRGERNPAAKLTPAQVAEIRAVGASQTQRALARRYGVSQALVGRILRGLLW